MWPALGSLAAGLGALALRTPPAGLGRLPLPPASPLPLPLPLPEAPGYFQAIFNSAELPVQKVDRMGVLQLISCLFFSRGPYFLEGWSFLTLGETVFHL